MIYRYRFISEHRTEFGVQRLCQVSGLRRQGFLEWIAAETARAARAEAEGVRLTGATPVVHNDFSCPQIPAAPVFGPYRR
ncbi:hypothetical protein [Amycolatopsis sp. lyj-23]|uniref:hypothetical protein n=1 Tax=Amycolatopsis sp. lyj-23 TaxID=2789283 RepID=UPI003979935F